MEPLTATTLLAISGSLLAALTGLRARIVETFRRATVENKGSGKQSVESYQLLAVRR